MAERGSSKHGARLDDEMKQEAQSMTKGHRAAHVEEGRESEPFPDSTDGAEVQQAIGLTADPEEEEEA
ncbi:hypothetical protein [Arthrobacter sp. A5]|uniref:hypothetical protein n=1 Tax=Arthrobacter sp. A5 TaxID=576926 RepID=UPI003DA9309E